MLKAGKMRAIRLMKTTFLSPALVILAVMAHSPATGQQLPPEKPLPSPTPLLDPAHARERTLAALERHCSQCHGEEAGTDGGGLSHIQDLDALSRDPALVRPGLPDGSPLYQVLLARHRPLAALANGKGPAPAEVEAVRDWIETLDDPRGGCVDRAQLPEAGTARLIEGWKRQFPEWAHDTRAVTLAHLSNICLSDRQLAHYRDDVAGALARIAGRATKPRVETLGDLSVLLVFRLSEAGISEEAWSAIEREAPRTMAGAVPGDWLAVRAEPNSSALLARRYRDEVNLKRAAAELGASEADLSTQLGALTGADARLARQLRQWQISRNEWEHLAAVLAQKAPVHLGDVSPAVLRLGLWSDKPKYQTGELVTVTAMSNRDCNLTLIGVDREGYATVLFPSDFDQDNRLRGGSPMSLPTRRASYQLRARDPGKETIVGICQTHRERPEGISHNFEGLRFTALGSWRAFLRVFEDREAEILRREQPRSRRNRNRSEPKVATANNAPAGEARAAIRFDVE